MTACAADWVDAASGRSRARPIPRSCARYDELFPVYRRDAARDMRPVWRKLAARCATERCRCLSAIAIIGDRFMLPACLRDGIRARCGTSIDIRTLELPWPDEPMEHGYAKARPRRPARSIIGDPDEIVAFIGDAEILVTHLAPLSRCDAGAAAEAETGRGLARRPGQHRHGGGARAAASAWSTRPAAMPAPWPNSPSAPSSPRRA